MADRSKSSSFFDTEVKVGPDVPLYEMMETKGRSDPSYSMVNMATMNTENVYDVPVTTNTVTGGGNKRDEDVKKSNRPIYLVAISVSAILLIVVVVCFIALFLEVAKLKAETLESQPQQTSTPSIMLHLQQINGSLQSIEMRFQDFINIQAGKVQQLNNSLISSVEAILSLHEATVSLQNTQMQQLNTSLLSSIEDNIQNMNIRHLVNEITRFTSFIGLNSFNPANSCAALLHTFSSGYYWVRASNGSAVHVYCDMTRSCGGVTGGWARVAYLDMTNSSHQCPSGFRQRTDSNKRTCGTNADRCFLFPSSTATLEYSKVCGKIIAYQIGIIDGFRSSNTFPPADGIVLTHGDPRQHIWTFTAARDEIGIFGICPCINTNYSSLPTQPPVFVENDYFCDTGSNASATYNTFYGDDPLWDGAGCGPLNTCCSFNNPPWFYRQLPQPTTDNIEINVCRDGTDEDIAVETMEIYVQ